MRDETIRSFERRVRAAIGCELATIPYGPISALGRGVVMVARQADCVVRLREGSYVRVRARQACGPADTVYRQASKPAGHRWAMDRDCFAADCEACGSRWVRTCRHGMRLCDVGVDGCSACRSDRYCASHAVIEGE